MNLRTASFLCLLFALHAAAAASGTLAQTGPSTFRIHAAGVAHGAVEAVRSDLGWAEDRIAGMLGAFRDSVSVRIFPDRADFSEALRHAWGMPETECWMVGGADDHVLYLLSPAAWGEEACDHDPGDDLHRRMLIAHEAVHAYHGQANPSEDLGLLEDLDWFTEGLATYISGQFDDFHAARAREAITTGAGPERLAQAWTGTYRYGVAGSMAAFIDTHWGRATLREALTATSQASLLALLGTDEDAFLNAWKDWVLVR